MTNKEKYKIFCEKTYVPIYSKSWWLDAVCGKDNWDVWIYENGMDILAAMPYYVEKRGEYVYITKAPLTQNNGIIFKYYKNAGEIAKQLFEEKIINAACDFIEGMNVDVYEQQYSYTFRNWLPFFWNYYTEITRYTFIIDDTSDLEAVWSKINNNRRKKIQRGQKETQYKENLGSENFYCENKKIYQKQGLQPPFSYELWNRLFEACKKNNSGKTMYRATLEGNIACISFIVWDEKFVYKLIGGAIPEFSNLEGHSAMTWDEIQFAHDKGLKFDFEGSVIKRISKSFREFGGEPKPYFRIRKVFNPLIVRQEMEEQIKSLTQ